jgi:hypothetical protein
MKLFPHRLSQWWHCFLVCTSSDEIAALAQHVFGCPCKNCQNLYSVQLKSFPQKSMKSFSHMLSQSMLMYNFLKSTLKGQIKMQFSSINNQNFEKPSRIPSNRTIVNILWQKILDTSQQTIFFTYAQSPWKCSNIEKLAKI